MFMLHECACLIMINFRGDNQVGCAGWCRVRVWFRFRIWIRVRVRVGRVELSLSFLKKLFFSKFEIDFDLVVVYLISECVGLGQVCIGPDHFDCFKIGSG
jgi:hypothetical protein